jgi:hypothetical protein
MRIVTADFRQFTTERFPPCVRAAALGCLFEVSIATASPFVVQPAQGPSIDVEDMNADVGDDAVEPDGAGSFDLNSRCTVDYPLTSSMAVSL